MVEVEGCMMRSSSSSSSGDSSSCNSSFENAEYFHGEETTHEVDEEIEIFSNEVRDTRNTETRNAHLPISSKGFSERGTSEEGFGINYTPIAIVNVNEHAQMHVIRSTVDSSEESEGEFSFSETNEYHNMEAINFGIKRVMNDKGEEDPNFKEYIPVGKVHASVTVDGGDGFHFGDIPSIEEPLVLSSHDNPTEQTFRNVCGRQQALREIIDVYGSGMGDQEVLLLDGKFNEKTIIDPEKDHYGLNAIKEEDENDDDDDDHSSINIPIENLAQTTPSDWDTLDVSLEIYDNSQVCTIEMDYNQALLYFQGLNLQSFESSIVTEEPTKSSFLSFGGSTKLDFSESQMKLKFPFLVACVNYDPFCSEHFSMLKYIYCKLISGDRKLQPIDKCWENLGFQGSDPRTDLNRSMKCLSILQMLNFLESEEALAKQLFSLSQSFQDSGNISVRMRNGEGDSSWPFMCVAIMFTKEALQALRCGALNVECNKRKNVLDALNEYHHACFGEFCSYLNKQPTVHHAHLLAKLRSVSATKPHKILEHFRKRKYLLHTNISTTVELASLTPLDTIKETSFEPKINKWKNIFQKNKAEKFSVK